MNLLSEPTIATTMEVVVDELCNSTVARMPIVRSAMGLLKISFSLNVSPACLPVKATKFI